MNKTNSTKNTKFIVDAPADIPREKAEELDITVLPIPITIDGRGFFEGLDFTAEEFYDILLNAKEIPKTSQITSAVFLEEYEKCYKEGYTRIIVVTINSKASNTYNSSVMARDMFFEEHPDALDRFEIINIDSGTYTICYGLPVMIGAEMLKKGDSPYDVIKTVESLIRRVRIYFCIYSLEFAKKSGRIGVAAAFVGDMLGLKPIMTVKDKEIIIVDKVRGTSPALSKVMKKARSHVEDVKDPGYAIIGGMQKDMTADFEKAVKKEFGNNSYGTFSIGPSIAINAGPRLNGILVFEDEE